MKTFSILFALFVFSVLNAQVTTLEGEKFVTFKLKYKADYAGSDVGINWKKEQPVSEFTLNGKIPAKYSIRLENDTLSTILKQEGGKWIVKEKMEHSPWPLRKIDDKVLVSEFKITDFDKDGNEDLVCWVNTNINGNQWSLIYLNDGQKLIKLWNDADETAIWDRPEYDETTGFISIQRDGSAYGTSEESIFLLEGYGVSPVSKHYQDREEESITDYYYAGNNGKWELYQTFKDNTRQVEFKLPKGVTDFEKIDWKKAKLTQEFELAGKTPLKYRIALLNDTEALLEEYKNNQWIVKDTLGWFESEVSYNTEESFTDSFTITDFNRDGNEDFLCWHLTNVNGNEYTSIYLNDPECKTLVKLKNPDENVWAAPEYDKLTDIITSTIVAGMFGVESESTYRLDGMTAIPLLKKEFDSLNLSLETGEGKVLRTYNGKNGKWELVSEEKLQLEKDED